MYEDYISRYMDMRRCDAINEETMCPECGHTLKAQHSTDFDQHIVIENLHCPFCRKYDSESAYFLQ